jgi:invasion protein IalB
MTRSSLYRMIICVLSLGLSGPVLAQDSSGAADAAIDTETLPVGQTYIRETITDWSLRCMRGTASLEEDSCQLYQLLTDPSGNPVSEFTLLPAPAGSEVAALVTIITPLETVLTEGLILSIDEMSMPPQPFVWCNRTGCYSRFGISGDEIEAMKRGAVASVSIVALAAPQQRIEVTASLRGFTAAFDRLSMVQQPPQ